jgi:hypothetical protein
VAKVAVHSFSSRQNQEGIPMKRFALVFAWLVLSTQIAGCSGESTSSSKPAGDANKVGEAKQYEAKVKAEREARAAKAAAKAAPTSR